MTEHYDVIIIGSGAGGLSKRRVYRHFLQAFTHLALIEALSLLIASEPQEDFSFAV
jgi:pyruvate/2-oxoglutarate dehydrogenase complex dihydrolipoamide dehydrogenase (E3) component